MRLAPNLAPEKIISASAVVAAVVLLSAVWLSTQVPSLGVSWRAAEGRVQVAGVHDPAEATALHRGQIVAGMSSPRGPTLNLEPVDLTPEPDMAFKRYTDMDAFFARQSERRALLGQHTVVLNTNTGPVEVSPTPTRPLLSLPVVFWFQLFCGIAGLIAGASVWAYRRQDPATKYYALTGIGLMCSACTAAVYSTRELAIDGQLFKALSAINEFGAVLFCGSLIAVLWYYPTRLGRLSLGPWIVAVYVAFGVAIPLRLHNSVELLTHYPITLGYLATYGLAAAQWRKTRRDPLQRAALRWFLFSWLFGSGAFLAFVYLPALMGYDSGAIQGYAFGFFVLIYIGVAIGVLRYQLFRLDRWWFIAWTIFLGGLAVIALDLMFIYVLQMNIRASLLVSMMIAGWLYFPLRQWLVSRLSYAGHSRHSPELVRMVTQVLAHPQDDANQAWRTLLQQVYLPSTLTQCATNHKDKVDENGLALTVAGNEDVSPQKLQYCQGGARLFNPGDLNMLADLRALFAEVLGYRQRLEQAVFSERDRVARDLHDDVGARLLTLSHSLENQGATQARHALSELRSVVYSMQAAPVSLEDLLGDWRAETAERCEAAGKEFSWTVSGSIPTLTLTGGPALALTRVLRETLSNALRHSNAPKVALHFAFTNTLLHASIAHTFDGPPPQQWQSSLGLRNLRERLARMNGSIDWCYEHQRLDCHWSLDVACIEHSLIGTSAC